MEDAIKVLSTKFDLQSDVLQKIGSDSEDASSWLMVLGAYVLDNDKKLEEQATNEVLLRKQRLNAGLFSIINYNLGYYLIMLRLLNIY